MSAISLTHVGIAPTKSSSIDGFLAFVAAHQERYLKSRGVKLGAGLALLLPLAACGGGGGGGGGITTSSGFAADGYIVGGTVARVNGSGNTVTTDSTGHFSGLTGNGAIKITGGTNSSTNTPLTATLIAPAGATAITPITTLIYQLAGGLNASATAIANATTTVATALGIANPSGGLLNFDPVANFSAGTNAQIAAVGSEILGFIAGAQTDAVAHGAVSGTATNDAVTNAVLSGLATQIGHGTVDLSNVGQVTTLLQDVFSALHLVAPAAGDAMYSNLANAIAGLANTVSTSSTLVNAAVAAAFQFTASSLVTSALAIASNFGVTPDPTTTSFLFGGTQVEAMPASTLTTQIAAGGVHGLTDLIALGVTSSTDFVGTGGANVINSATYVVAQVGGASATTATLSAANLDHIDALDIGTNVVILPSHGQVIPAIATGQTDVTLDPTWTDGLVNGIHHLTSVMIGSNSSLTATNDQVASLLANGSIGVSGSGTMTVNVVDDVGRSISLPNHIPGDTVVFTAASATNSHFDTFTNTFLNTGNDKIDLSALVNNAGHIQSNGISGISATSLNGANLSAGADIVLMQSTAADVTNVAQVASAIGTINGITSAGQQAVLIVSATGATGSTDAVNTTGIWLFTAGHASAGAENVASNTGDLHLLATFNTLVNSNEVITHH